MWRYVVIWVEVEVVVELGLVVVGFGGEEAVVGKKGCEEDEESGRPSISPDFESRLSSIRSMVSRPGCTVLLSQGDCQATWTLRLQEHS